MAEMVNYLKADTRKQQVVISIQILNDVPLSHKLRTYSKLGTDLYR